MMRDLGVGIATPTGLLAVWSMMLMPLLLRAEPTGPCALGLEVVSAKGLRDPLSTGGAADAWVEVKNAVSIPACRACD